MKPLLIDTSGWCAVYNRSDINHHRACACWKQIAQTLGLFYTTDYILDETLTLLRTRVDHKAAVEFGRIILSSRVVKVLPIIGERWRKAWRLFVKYEDKNFSFTDCTSFVVMKELRLPAALAFDHHFPQMGFITVPGAV